MSQTSLSFKTAAASLKGNAAKAAPSPRSFTSLQRIRVSLLRALGFLREAGQGLKAKSDSFLFSRAQRSSFFCTVYYSLCSSAFRSEQVALAHGLGQQRVAFERGEYSPMLLGNLRRLEKAMLLTDAPWQVANEFIEETVQQYASRLTQARDEQERAELIWASSLLKEFFKSAPIESNEMIRAKFRFRNTLERCPAYLSNVQPIERNKDRVAPPPAVSCEAFAQLTRQQRSHRRFETRLVPRHCIEKAVSIAHQAPSVQNRQPFRFRIFEQPERAAEIAALSPDAERFAQDAPAVVAIIGQLDAIESERDRHLVYTEGALAATSLIYALQTQGLHCCLLPTPEDAARDQRTRAALSLQPYQRLVLLIAFGYPEPEELPETAPAKRPIDICSFDPA